KFTRDVQKLTDLYDASQFVIPDGAALKGLQIGGPGALAISAGRTDSGISMDLGASKGIRSVGALLNPSLDSLPRQSGGAKGDLTLDLAGDLKMISSQIATFNGGKISVTATHGGTLNVGSQEQFTSDDTPKGIY